MLDAKPGTSTRKPVPASVGGGASAAAQGTPLPQDSQMPSGSATAPAWRAEDNAASPARQPAWRAEKGTNPSATSPGAPVTVEDLDKMISSAQAVHKQLLDEFINRDVQIEQQAVQIQQQAQTIEQLEKQMAAETQTAADTRIAESKVISELRAAADATKASFQTLQDEFAKTTALNNQLQDDLAKKTAEAAQCQITLNEIKESKKIRGFKKAVEDAEAAQGGTQKAAALTGMTAEQVEALKQKKRERSSS